MSHLTYLLNHHYSMRRVSCKGNWTLFSPDEAPGLDEAYGEAFDTLYERYEHEHRGRDTIKAMVLWDAIIKAQTETGNPFMLYKDSANGESTYVLQRIVGTYTHTKSEI